VESITSTPEEEEGEQSWEEKALLFLSIHDEKEREKNFLSLLDKTFFVCSSSWPPVEMVGELPSWRPFKWFPGVFSLSLSLSLC